MRRRLRLRNPDERGALAVIVALCCVVLFGVAALGVDLGNAMNRHHQVQTQADFAALAAGASLPVGASPAANDPAVKAARDYLNRDQPLDDSNNCLATKNCVSAAQLVDGNLANGEVTYLGTDKLKVTAPPANVEFGLAKAIGQDDANVQATATVGIFSPGTGVMPTYAVTGCDWGVQTLTDPSTGQTTPVVPPLEDSPGDSPAKITTINPTQVAVGATGVVLSVNGTKLDGDDGLKTIVGFFRSTASPAPTKVAPVTPIAAASGTFLQVVIPTTVTNVEDIWWVRVRTWDKNKGDQWSPASEAVPFRVGEAVLECVGASNDGNFGTLILPRLDIGKSDWLAANMAKGLQTPLTLHTYDGAITGTGECVPSPPTTNAPYTPGGANSNSSTRYAPSGQATSTADLVERTNCVDTDTGLPANAATAGMITGTDSNPGGSLGRLENKPTKCGPGNGTQSRTATLSGKSYTFNNDMLTCFFTDSSATVASVSQQNYTFNGGNPVISAEIYKSPRFFWVPVLKVKPATGGSKHYFIIDFRPTFVTGNPASATKGAPGVTTSDDNGILIQGQDVKSMKVVFLNRNAIEIPDGGPVTPYLGGGTKLVRLID